MERGTTPVTELAGGLDLQATVESGQTYVWDREDGEMFGDDHAWGGNAWYWTTVPDAMTDAGPELVRVRQVDGRLEWEATCDVDDAYDYLVELLRLDDDLDAIMAETPADPLLTAAYDRYRGMRLVRDPPFASLVSFICSAQMRVARIHGMQQRLRREYGEPLEIEGETYYTYPTPERLAAATEADLRDLRLGYRAPYVQRTAEMVADGVAHPAEARDRPYEEAREYLTQFVGVGEKVADCVLLFSLGYLEAVPLDTWIRTAIAEHYPDCDRGNYTDTSRAIREQFGGRYAGYAQTYVFFHLRTGGGVDAG
jgi:N-glycosylase/DNA lyase